MRIGLAAFSAALALDRSPNPIAPPAMAEILTNFRLVVNLISSGSMLADFSECNRTVQTYPLAFVIDAATFHGLESSPWQTSWVE
jgi:hypothetical protein